MSSFVIHTKNLTIEQHGCVVLQNVCLEVEPGALVLLTGKTGSGKTSLLRALYADLPIKSGIAEVAGVDVHTIKRVDIPKLRRNLGIVSQELNLLPDRNIFDNLYFVLKATDWTETPIKDCIDQALTHVGMDWAIHKMPHELSAGEQQRVAIARAILHNPLVLLADEPTSHLDSSISDEIMELFWSINRLGTAMLMATHDMRLVDQCDARVLKCEDNLLKG